MISARTHYVYKAFGMQLSSEIAMPELLPLTERERSEALDLIITVDDLEQRWNELASEGHNFVAKQDVCLFKIPDTAIYCIEAGKKLTVSPILGADEAKVRLYVLGTCMGAILMQRSVLPLHGSAVVIDGKAYAFVGESGAGKSTLASAFVKSGYPLLTDDVIAVTIAPESGLATVHPAYPQQKLWQQSIDHFGMQASNYNTVSQEIAKFAVPVIASFEHSAIPLAGIFELTKADDDSVSMSPMNTLERLYALMRHTYRTSLIPKLGLQQWHFSTTSSIAGQVDMYRLYRSTQRFTAFDLVDQIVHQVGKGEYLAQ
ncbi:aldolase [Paenibacillus sp. SYP-B3998]|uniref:Aldolase n=1 Tax=Paenibacillus sp. SYP-B3998 TaxID=2678564 RepID=A0A6G3ZZM3_9BACL|nr:aldolase [Paenibacillus sp. SYP-B3998]NEW07134.1 aldolase [Paenibacillus sp. SYP-B3998]